MDFNGDYPGSRVKRLRVDTTADIGGDVKIDGSLTVSGGASFDLKTVHTEDGKETLPSHSFKDEKTTGMYRSGTGELSFSVGGTKKLQVSSTGSTVIGPLRCDSLESTGTATTPGGVFGDGFADLYGAVTVQNGPLLNPNSSILGVVTATQLTVSGPSNLRSIFATGTVSCGTQPITCGSITSSGNFTCGTQAVTCGAITSSGNFSCGTKSVTCGPVSCASVASTGPVTCSDLYASGTVAATQISSGNINGFPAYARGNVGFSFGVWFDSGWHILGFEDPSDSKDIKMSSTYLVVSEKGYYTINARTICSASTGGSIRACRIRKQSGQILAETVLPNYDPGQPVILTAIAHAYLTSDADDWINFDVYVNSVFPNTYDFTNGTYDMHSTAV